MEASQVIAGRALTNPGCFISTVHNGYSYLAFVTSHSVVIVSEFTKTEQVIPNPEKEIRSIAWNSVTGALTVAFPHNVYQYIPEVISEKTKTIRRWFLIKKINFPETEIYQIAWLDRLGQLLICGNNIEIWRFPYEIISSQHKLTRKELDEIQSQYKPELKWKHESTSKIYYCSTSPDCRYFVTAGRYDRLPKLWYIFYEQSEESLNDPKNNPFHESYDPYKSIDYELQYRFNYLPHPRSITSLQWRPGKKPISIMQNLLLTTCMDGITRIWSENQPFSFNTCCVIQGKLNHTYSWIHYHPYIQDPPDCEDLNCNTESELKLAIEYDSKKKPSTEAENQNDLLNKFRKKQKSRFLCSNSSSSSSSSTSSVDCDWIIEIEKDLVVSFWKLSGINSSLLHNFYPQRKLPVLSLWLKTKISREPLNVSFSNPKFFIPICRELSNQNNEPVRVCLQILSSHGSLGFWDLLIYEHSISRMGVKPRSCLQLRGHHESISSFINHSSNLSLLATHSTIDNEILLWYVTETNNLVPSRLLLPLNTISNSNGLVWLHDSYFLTFVTKTHSNNTELLIFQLKNSSSPKITKRGYNFITSISTNNNEIIDQLYLLPDSISSPFSLFSIDNNGLLIRFWNLEIDITSDENYFSSLKCTQEISFDDGQNIQCHSFIPSNSSNNFINHISNDSKFNFSFITGGQDGYVRLWNKNHDNDNKWVESYKFEAHVSDIIEIKSPNSFNIITLGPTSNENNNNQQQQQNDDTSSWYQEIRTWERYSEFPHFKLNQVIPIQKKKQQNKKQSIVKRRQKTSQLHNNNDMSIFGSSSATKNIFSSSNDQKLENEIIDNDNNICFDIFNLTNGNVMIAVCYEKNVYIFIQQISEDIFDFHMKWYQSSATFTIPFSCDAIHWHDSGNLFVASGHQIFVFSPWQEIISKVQLKTGTLIQQGNVLSQTPPPFHPKILIQYLIAAKFSIVSKILIQLYEHLIKLIKENENEEENETNTTQISVSADELVQPSLREFIQIIDYSSITNNSSTNTNTNDNNSNSLSSGQDTAANLFGGNSSSGQDTAANLFSSGFGSASSLFQPTQTFSNASSLFTSSTNFISTEEEEEEKEEEKPEEEDQKPEEENQKEEEKEFGEEEAEKLNEILSQTRIIGLSNLDQMYLICVIDTFIQMKSLITTLDECGVRYLLFIKLCELLRKTLKKPITLTSREYIWGMHCEATDTLVKLTLPDTSTWNTAQSLGIGFWCTNVTILREVIKNIAKVEFNIQKSPQDCAIFYIALGQKAALMSLFKATGNVKVAEFLQNDFNEARWKSAASKNAYTLLGRQQYRYAAAFFLLSGNIKNAIAICIKHLKDYNLPLVFCRLLEGDTGENYKFLLQTHILPLAEKTNDMWLSCATHWLLKDYKKSLNSLIPEQFFDEYEEEEEENDKEQTNSSNNNPFNTFSSFSLNFDSSATNDQDSLRSSTDSKTSVRSMDTLASLVSNSDFIPFDPSSIHLYRLLSKKPFISSRPTYKEERILIRNCIYGYLQAGCPILALEEVIIFIFYFKKNQKTNS